MKKVCALFLTGIIILVFSGISFGGETYTYTTTAFDGYGDNGLDHYRAYSWEIDLIDSEGYGFDNDTETLDSVTLVFSDIYDNTNGDIFQVSVLDSDDVINGTYVNNRGYVTNGTYVAEGIYSYYDNNYSSNYFTSYYSGVKDGNDYDTLAAELLFSFGLIDESENQVSVTYNSNNTEAWTVVGDYNATHNTYAVTYNGNVIDALTAYISNNVLTLGLDPDCHYYASSISLILNTSDTPSGVSQVPEPETMVLFGLGLLSASSFGRKRFSSKG